MHTSLVDLLISMAEPASALSRPGRTEELRRADSQQLLTLIEQIEGLKARADALSLAATGELARRARADCLALAGSDASAHTLRRARSEARTLVEDEIMLATGMGLSEARARVAFATADPTRTATLRTQLSLGSISWFRARCLFGDTTGLTSEAADEVAGVVLATTRAGCALSHRLFRQRLSRELARRIDQQRQHAISVEARDSSVSLNPDGTGGLMVSGSAARVVAAHDRVSALARQLRAGGDARTLGQLRSDITLDLLLHAQLPTRHAPGQSVAGQLPPARVTVTVSLASLLGISNEPGEVAGVGYLAAGMVRELAYAAGSTWRRLVTDPATGHAIELSTTRYAPGPRLRDAVIARDAHCRAPGCTVPAERCDLDHDVDWTAGGATSLANLSAKHRRHHNHKTAGWWRTEQDPASGHITWTTWAGRRYETSPKRYDQAQHQSSPAHPPRPKARTG